MSTSERTARFSAQERRLVYWLTPNQCRSVEVRNRTEAEELVEPVALVAAHVEEDVRVKLKAQGSLGGGSLVATWAAVC